MALVLSEAMSCYGADDVVDDGHKHDLVMPGFRFHPTEEELIDFYLRRKIEGKRFNVELINFLDLYRYDPWELPALAAIGEKEWFFYVPRDRKYRNGDRPNRVTTSGYWKATGADRMIRNDSSRPIGLKKTLVFYLGKAPKGVRTSWIMNEYRLPQSDTDQLHKTEISLCRVYKRPGIEDVRRLPSKPSCSKRSVTEVSPPDSAYTSMVDDRTCPISSMPTSTTPSMTNIEELNAVIGYDRSYIRHRSDQLPLLPLPSQPQALALNAVSASSMTTGSNQIWEWCPLQETSNGYTSFK